ncbi:MAG TPA: DoxX family protein [Pirellulales bacterium]|nr:DoxX family protein [Pirellulales bacterium]
MTRHPIRIGFATVAALVLLRVTIGWHFLYQGIAKLEDPDFSSAAFLGQAKGPLGDDYRSLVDDWDGRQSLAADHRQAFIARIDDYLRRFDEAYRPSPEQTAAAQQMAGVRKAQTQDLLDDNETDFDGYLHELDRLAQAKQSPSRWTPYQQKRIWDKQTELQGQLKAWRSELNGIYDQFRQDLDSLLDDDQRARVGGPSSETAESRIARVDRYVSYGVTAIGLLLLVGLFTRLASLSGALFLLSIVLAQPDWPGLYPPPHPAVGRSLLINKEFVEMMALFALATTHVGRWGGLDFFVHYLFVRPLFGKREST